MKRYYPYRMAGRTMRVHIAFLQSISGLKKGLFRDAVASVRSDVSD